MPFKLNQDRRHRIPRQKHRVTNPATYDAALRWRKSLTVWDTKSLWLEPMLPVAQPGGRAVPGRVDELVSGLAAVADEILA